MFVYEDHRVTNFPSSTQYNLSPLEQDLQDLRNINQRWTKEILAKQLVTEWAAIDQKNDLTYHPEKVVPFFYRVQKIIDQLPKDHYPQQTEQVEQVQAIFKQLEAGIKVRVTQAILNLEQAITNYKNPPYIPKNLQRPLDDWRRMLAYTEIPTLVQILEDQSLQPKLTAHHFIELLGSDESHLAALALFTQEEKLEAETQRTGEAARILLPILQAKTVDDLSQALAELFEQKVFTLLPEGKRFDSSAPTSPQTQAEQAEEIEEMKVQSRYIVPAYLEPKAYRPIPLRPVVRRFFTGMSQLQEHPGRLDQIKKEISLQLISNLTHTLTKIKADDPNSIREENWKYLISLIYRINLQSSDPNTKKFGKFLTSINSDPAQNDESATDTSLQSE